MSSASSLKITLDTNCIINAFDEQHRSATSTEHIERLFELLQLGEVDVAVTTRVSSDLLNDPNSERKAHIQKRASTISVVGTVGRWGVSNWGGGDFWAGQEQISTIETIQKILFPSLSPQSKRYANKRNDIDHLAGHLLNGRDVFVTDDVRDIWSKREQLKEKLGILIMKPVECVRLIESSNSRQSN